MRSEIHGSTITVFLVADLDAAHVESARAFIDETVSGHAGITDLVLDLTESGWVDSVGLGLLIATRTYCQESGITLTLRGLSHRLHRVLVLSGLATLFDITTDTSARTSKFPLPESLPLPAVADDKFDQIAELTRRAVGAPQAFVTMLDTEKMAWPGAAGVPEDTSRVRPIAYSLCEHVVTSGEPLVVADTRADERVRDNPSVLEGLAAYAGMPLVDLSGTIVGTLCVADHEPREWTEAQLRDLADLADVASAELQLRGAVAASAVSTDRARIANDLNSRVFNELLSLSMLIGSAQSITDGRATELLDEAATKTEDILKALRSAIFDRAG